MTQKNKPGYPLPTGALGDDEIVCQLVYLPNRDEYWQALLGAISYMSTWHAWERDTGKRGKDAAANWREAFELTMECWRMTCLDEITDRMDIMIDLLGSQPGCCGATTIGPVITVVTTINPGIGDDPTVWGETAVADWEEWREYICYHAHAYVDSLINSAKAIDVAIELGSFTLDFFTGVMGFLQYLGLDQVLGLNQVMLVYEAFRDENDLSGWFTPLSARFEAARQDIVCSLILGYSLSDAVEAAVDDNAVWLLFYNFTDYASVQALMYEGTADGVGYLPAIKRVDCTTCEYEQAGESDVFIEVVLGTFIDYDEGEKEWTYLSQILADRTLLSIRFWEDDTKTTEKQFRFTSTSCDVEEQYLAQFINQGILAGFGNIWEFNDPHLVALDQEMIDGYVSVHPTVEGQFTLTFKLYN